MSGIVVSKVEGRGRGWELRRVNQVTPIGCFSEEQRSMADGWQTRIHCRLKVFYSNGGTMWGFDHEGECVMKLFYITQQLEKISARSSLFHTFVWLTIRTNCDLRSLTLRKYNIKLNLKNCNANQSLKLCGKYHKLC